MKGKSNASLPLCTSNSKSKKERIRLQGTRKIGCPAVIHIREYVLYPAYKTSYTDFQSNWQFHKEKGKMLGMLREDLWHKKMSKNSQVFCFFTDGRSPP